MKRKFMSKNVNIRDLLEKADKTLYKKRSNDPECPFFQFLPKEKNTRYNLRNTSVSVPRIYTDRFKNVFSDLPMHQFTDPPILRYTNPLI